jgi:hypothetical protein
MEVLSRYMSTPRKEKWTIKRVFRYVHGTTKYASYYKGKLEIDREVNIHGFVDVDWVGDVDQRRSTSGYVFILFNGEMSWMSKKHATISLSTIEVAYMTSTYARKESVCLNQLCLDIGFEKQTMTINCESQSAIF